MIQLFVKEGRRYRSALRSDVTQWLQATIAGEVRGKTLLSPADSRDFLIQALAGEQSEVFAVVYLDNRHRVLRFEIAFRGTIDNATVYPRELVRRALELNAAAVILSHNHPSGVLTPSQADELITRRIRSAMELVDVRLLDHFVIGGGKAVSMAAQGLI